MSINLEQPLDASPEHVWRVILAARSWPEWCPIFQMIEPEDPADPLGSEWRVNGLLGRIPYSGLFRVEEHQPVDLLRLISIRTSPPYQIIEHEIEISDGPVPRLRWEILYRLSGGPGGWLIDRLVVRRHVPEQLQRTIGALADRVGGHDDAR